MPKNDLKSIYYIYIMCFQIDMYTYKCMYSDTLVMWRDTFPELQNTM